MASPPLSPSDDVSPSLEQLVTYFLAAKHALASTNPILRANEIVTSARALIDEAAVLQARNLFLRTSVRDQEKFLDRVVAELDQIGKSAEVEFQASVRVLDASDTKLKSMMAILRSTETHPLLSPTSSAKPLYSFVDEDAVAVLTAALHASIDNYKDAADTLTNVTDTFKLSLVKLHHAIASLPSASASGSTEQSPLPSSFLALTTQATEMADLLRGLVRHYDMCVSALKHTDGGGEVVAQAGGSDLESDDGGAGTTINVAELASPATVIDETASTPAAAAAAAPTVVTSLSASASAVAAKAAATSIEVAPTLPIGEDERAEMMVVLEKDATELEDVIAEMKERGQEMESEFDVVTSELSLLREEDSFLRTIVHMLDHLGDRLPILSEVASEFVARWREEKLSIAERLDEMDSLRHFYEGFLASYDCLLVEVGRRRSVQVRMEKIADEAAVKIEKLRLDDLEEREAFRAEEGRFLPSDIWPGLSDPPAMYGVGRMDSQIINIPNLPKDILEAAAQRTRGKT